MVSGTRLCRKYFCSASWNDANIGKAEKIASATVTSGTSEISVVKVRLLAVRPRWSSRKRAAACAGLEPGPVCSGLEQQRDAHRASARGRRAHGRGIHCWHDSHRDAAALPARRGLDAARGRGQPARPDRWPGLGAAARAHRQRFAGAEGAAADAGPWPACCGAACTPTAGSLLVWLYFIEGVVRAGAATANLGWPQLALVEVVLTLVLFAARLRGARARACASARGPHDAGGPLDAASSARPGAAGRRPLRLRAVDWRRAGARPAWPWCARLDRGGGRRGARCAEFGASVVPQGGNTGWWAPGVPDDSGTQVLLHLGALNRVRGSTPPT